MLSLLLHIYQPPTQFPEVTKDITRKCYQKIVELLKKYPSAKITLNIPASLTEQLVDGMAPSILMDLRNLVRRGQVELTGTAAYHPLLPKIPESEVRRQIRLNDKINKKYFGDAYQPRGFFPPEMAYTRRLVPILENFGFEWVVLDQSALPPARNSKFPARLASRLETGGQIPNSKLTVFFRNNELSLGVAFGQIRTLKDLTAKLSNCLPSKALAKEGQTDYCILAMDGETFGHHLPGQLKLLEDLFKSQLKLVTVSELLNQDYPMVEIEPQTSSWGPKTRWDNPRNPVHQLQWELTNLAIGAVRNSKYSIQGYRDTGIQGEKSRYIIVSSPDEGGAVYPYIKGRNLTPKQCQWLEARELLDRALHSDQYFWAAHDPCWHPQMVERGARMLRDVVLAVPDASQSTKQRAQELYTQIVKTGKRLYGEEIVVC